MDPLQVSWLVKACCVLHNHCLDWGLRKLKPRQNIDPTVEADILVKTAERRSKSGKKDDQLNEDAPPRGNYGPTHVGVVRRVAQVEDVDGWVVVAQVGTEVYLPIMHM